MKRLSVLLLAFLPLLAACNNSSSSSGGTPKSADEIQKDEQDKLQNSASATDMTALITPDRIQVVKENISETDRTAFYTIGCKTQGQPDSLYQIDPLLQVGSQFRTEDGNHAITDERQSQNRAVVTVTNLQPNSISLEENYEFMSMQGTPFTSLDQVFKGRPNMTINMAFEFQADGKYPKNQYQLEYNLTDAAKSWVASQPNKDFYWYCAVIGNASQPSTSSYKADEILYNIMGRPVKAYSQKFFSSGEVVCEKHSNESSSSSSENKLLNVVKLGHGTQELFQIHTNQVASQNLAECGGVRVFMSDIVKLDSGKIISNRVEKTISAPLR